MKTLLMCLFFILFNLQLIYSNSLQSDTLIEKAKIVLFCSIDGKCFKVEKIKANQYLSYIDSVVLNQFDLKEGMFRNGYLNLNNKQIYFYNSYNNTNFYIWDIIKNKIVSNDSIKGTFLGFKNDYLFFGVPSKMEVPSYDPGVTFPYIEPINKLNCKRLGENSISKALDLKDEDDVFWGITNIIFFPDEEEIMVCGGLLMGDLTCKKSKYYLFNLKTKQLKDFEKSTLVNYKNNFTVSGLSSVFYYDIENNLYINTSIYNSRFEYLGESLHSYLDIYGYNIEGSKLRSFMVSSETDQKIGKADYKKVIISYKKASLIEISYYKIIKNEFLNERNINELTKRDLQMLINMIYAKYNYAFKNSYLQAYFNLYSFYKKGRENRKNDVDNLFNEIDRKNIEVINKLLKN